MSFYVTLLSDACLDTFPDNKQNQFRNMTWGVGERVDDGGEWEVGLSQFVAPFSWNNVTESNNSFGFYEGRGAKTAPNDENARAASPTKRGGGGGGELKWVEIETGYYPSPEHILQAMTEKLTPLAKKNIQFIYKALRRRVKLVLKNGATVIWKVPQNFITTSFVIKESDLGRMLGFEENYADKSREGKYEVEYKTGFNTLFVYCDVVTHSPVASKLLPLLRTVPVTVERGQIISAHFDSPDYIPLKVKHFESIAIEIRDDGGAPVVFESGKVLAKLHFRRIRK